MLKPDQPGEPLVASGDLAITPEDLERFEAELARYRRWVADLQSGMFISCVYCGHRYGPSDEHAATLIEDGATPSMQDALRAHIAECTEHPLARALAEKAELESRMEERIREGIERARYEQVDAWMQAELADFSMVVDHCSRIYDEVTGGRVSKPNTLPEVVIGIANDLERERTDEAVREETEELRGERDRLQYLISRPHVGRWLDEVLVEAAHQRERWGSEHDQGKAPEDWFWLVGFLVGKCLRAHLEGDLEKARHHTVSSAAALAHWAAQISGAESVMRPGLGPERLMEIGVETEVADAQ